MARHSNHQPAANLDSLMDALTNVVAVLILVLILLQADVGNTVDRMLESLTPASPEQVQAAAATLAQLTRDRDAARVMAAATAPDPAQMGDLKNQLTVLEIALKESDVRLLEIDKLRQLQTQHQQRLDAEKKQTNAVLDEIRKLEALLAGTPEPQVKKADVVRIPNIREFPSGADVYYAHVLGDRVHLVDPHTARKLVMDEFEKVRFKMLLQTIKVRNSRDRYIYDQDKMVKHFATLDLKVRGQKITVPPNRTGTTLRMHIEINQAVGGITLADMAGPRSEWLRICNLVHNLPRSVMLFRVRPDGFPTYIKAREIADGAELPCGWEINGSTGHDEQLPLEFNRLEAPKPPPGPPPVPKPPGPPAPKRVLD